MNKTEHVAQILETRIKNGDYVLHSMPPIRQLCKELSVNHITLRKSIDALRERGLIVRQDNGRFTAATHSPKSLTTARIALLAPAYSSAFIQTLKYLIEHIASEFMAELTLVDFIHWDDPAIIATLNKFDGVFLLPTAEVMPPHVRSMLSLSKCPLVIIDRDMSDDGVASLKLLTPEHISHLIGHLVEIGHREIDCLNTHPVDITSQERIAGWKAAVERFGVGGKLIDIPVESYQNPMHKAYDVVGRLMDTGQLTATAIFCTVQATAIGAMRALKDHGVEVGRQISVCAGADEGLAEYLYLSLTTIKLPDIRSQVSEYVKWMARGGRWEHDLYWQPDEVALHIGESTGPAPVRDADRLSPATGKDTN